ncbi:uncharacterized protein CELE_Y39B6A.5 [Caenorhabditis elegans]|uniref:Secreted protein n=2 Tax=Caenorhabditis elegans TaxID=6239 RepID=Q9NET2_CAEEL|nr:Secreted protein [Caenorhabditis elegans]CAC51072.1 Secreted protein [Caenorhabditis elegans]|eukprot:NP_001256844.1 Uncharacterized protein CELE_Y39B6A.5 [Caenorhabditis elegans]
MKFFTFLLVLITTLSVLFSGVSAEMDSKTPENAPKSNAPEHIPGSNMIGAGRGHRVQNWKSSQGATDKSDQPQQQQHQDQQK